MGPLEVTSGGQRLSLGGPRSQIALATLLLDVNRPVTAARLTEAIYEDSIPQTSRAQVQICISGLRRSFAAFGRPNIIDTVAPGYALRVPNESIDYHRFDERIRQAREARRNGQLEEAVQYYRAGLVEWRGPAFDGVGSRLVQTAADQLTERWITSNEDCIQLELELGRHHELAGELTALVATYPLRERLRGQLMLALYRSGRQAEALGAYRQAREAMLDELGIEPDERLQQLHHAILSNDESLRPQGDDALPVTVGPPPPPPAPAPASGAPHPAPPPRVPAAPSPVVPRLLPTDIDDFTGRNKQVEGIRQQLLLALDDPNRRAVPVVVLTGKPGIGKTTIAVHVSHAIADKFPDGQLFADLHGASANPVSAMQVLARFLRALGEPGMPMGEDLEERAEIYRGMLANRRMLVVLDDAGSESQVLPLLPGNPESVVIVTSRSRLAGVAGAIHLGVDVFDLDQSVDLLGQIAGRDKIDMEPDATRELAQLCGQLPLALRIAGARLAARPHWGVEQLVVRLEDETRRLDELEHGALGIRASISFAYESTNPKARRLFRRLAVLDAPVSNAWLSAALLDLPITESQDLLDDLADAQLIETTGTGRGIHSQYRFHDLIRVFARERLAAEETAQQRRAALKRALGAMLFMVRQVHRRQYGGDYVQIHGDASIWPLPTPLVDRLVDTPHQWYERERLTLVAGIRQAADDGFVDFCWELAIGAVTLFESRMYLDDWRETHEIALTAVRRADHTRGTAAVLYSIGSLRISQQRFDQARRDFDDAVALFEQVGDRFGRALTVRNLAFLDRMNGWVERAATGYHEALAVFRDTGDLVAAAYVMHNLAQLRIDDNDLNQAQRLLDEALMLAREAGSGRVQAQVLHRAGEMQLRRGAPDRATSMFEKGLAASRECGDRAGEAYTLYGLGMAQLAEGRSTNADATLRRAAQVSADAGERLVQARAIVGLADLALKNGDARRAVRCGQEALAIFRVIGLPIQTAGALNLLAEAYQSLDDKDRATTAAQEALMLLNILDGAVAPREHTHLDAAARRVDSSGGG